MTFFVQGIQGYFIIRKAPVSPPELIHVQLLLNSDIYPGQLQLPHCLMNFLGSPHFFRNSSRRITSKRLLFSG